MAESSLLSAFSDTVNRAVARSLEIRRLPASQELPTLPVNEPHVMVESIEEPITHSPEDYAQALYESDFTEAMLANDPMASLPEGADEEGIEQPILFTETEIELPFICDSYEQMATIVVGNVVRSCNLRSINVSIFGGMLAGTTPLGFDRVRYGRHVFFVMEKSDSLYYVFDFLHKAKESLDATGRYECPLVEPVSVNGVLAYTLVLDPKEFLEIKRSHRAYEMSYIPHEDIAQMKLVIKV